MPDEQRLVLSMADVSFVASSFLQTAAQAHMNLRKLQPANIQTIVALSCVGV
jgi:hypothetical protein